MIGAGMFTEQITAGEQKYQIDWNLCWNVYTACVKYFCIVLNKGKDDTSVNNHQWYLFKVQDLFKPWSFCL